MPESPPRPNLLVFLVCRYAARDEWTKEYSTCGIVGRIVSREFPATSVLSFFVEMSDCQGEYSIRFILRDGNDAMIQEFVRKPLQSPNPLNVWTLSWTGCRLAFPRPGRYDLILEVNGEELARRRIFVDPTG